MVVALDTEGPDGSLAAHMTTTEVLLAFGGTVYFARQHGLQPSDWTIAHHWCRTGRHTLKCITHS